MDLMLLRMFQRQVLLQCQFIQMAAIQVNNNLREGNPEATFYALQNHLLVAAHLRNRPFKVRRERVKPEPGTRPAGANWRPHDNQEQIEELPSTSHRLRS